MEPAGTLLSGSQRATPRYGAGSARYIGRVGALAVALGIGVAVVTSPGPALAGPEGTTDTVSEPQSSGAQQDSTTQPGSTASSETASTATATVTVTAGSPTASVSAPATPDPRNGTVQASGGANTTVTTSGGTTTTSTVTSVEAASPSATPSASADPPTAPPPATTDANEPPKTDLGTRTLPTSTLSAVTVSTKSVDPPATPRSTPTAASTAFSALDVAPRASTSIALISPSSAPATVTAPPVDPITAVVNQVISFAVGLASMVGLGPTLTADPVAPAQQPALWVLLAWVRRQFEQTYLNGSPLIGLGPITTSQSEAGAVTGTISTADPDRDPLALRVITGPNNGAVTVDSITGQFVYTPREALARTGGIDMFTVAVTELNSAAHWHGMTDFAATFSGADRGDTATATIYVPVLPIGGTDAGDTLDAAQLIRLVADGKAQISLNKDGTVRTIGGTFTDTVIGNSADAARAMNGVARLLGVAPDFADVNDITSQSVGLVDSGDPAEVIYRLRPTVNGIPTVASQVVLVTDAHGRVTGVLSSYTKGINDVTTSSTSLDEESVALAAARAALAQSLAAQGGDAAAAAAVLAAVTMHSDLVIYDVDPDVAPNLARRVTVYTTTVPTDDAPNVPVISTTYYIYANGTNAGDVFAAISNIADATTWVPTTDYGYDLKYAYRAINVEYSPTTYTYRANDVARNVSTYLAYSTAQAPGTMATKYLYWFWWTAWDYSAVSAHANAEATYDFYRNTLGRTAFDGAGSALRVSVLSGYYANAYWDPSLKILVFGNDYERALDVVGHEYTHGVVQYAVANGGGLIYQGESGALNESYADIMGSLIENKVGAARWQIAEDAGCGSWYGCTIRDMSMPSRYGQPQNYANRYTGTADNGGVHTNSGIFNFAAYKMMTDARTSTISTATWSKVFYGSLFKLASNAKFSDGRAAVLSSANSLGFTTTQQQAIIDAFNAVGIP